MTEQTDALGNSTRMEYDIIDDISIPKERWAEANYLEPVTKDYRNLGPGGATQAISFSMINSIKEIYKLRPAMKSQA